MASSIAKASLILSVSANALTSGLSAAYNQITAWSAKTTAVLASAARTATSTPALIATGLAAAGFALAGKSLADLKDEILQVDNSARNLGVSTAGLSAIGYASKIAGVETNDLTEAVAALRANLVAADEPARRLFGQLGLDVQELRSLPVDESLGRIAEGLASVSDPAERARLALQVFGDKAVQLQPLLNRGREGIAELTAEARRLGVAFDGTDAQRVRQASEAVARAGAAFTALKTQALIAIGPILEQLVALGQELGGIGLGANGLSEALRAVASVAADVYDAIAYAAGVWLEWQGAAMDAISPVVDGLTNLGALLAGIASTLYDAMRPAIEAVGQALSRLAERFEGLFSTIREGLDWISGGPTAAGEATREAGAQAQELGRSLQANFGESGRAVDRFFDRVAERSRAAATAVRNNNPIDAIRASVLQGLNSLEADIRKSLATVGMTGFHGRIFELQQRGASPEQLARVRQLAEQARNVDLAWQQVQMPPIETWERQLAGLEEMLESGRISWDQYARAVGQSNRALVDAANLGEHKTPQALLKDSSAAVSAQIQAQLQDRRQDPAAELRRAQLEIREINRRQLEVAEAQLRELERQRVDELVEVI